MTDGALKAVLVETKHDLTAGPACGILYSYRTAQAAHPWRDRGVLAFRRDAFMAVAPEWAANPCVALLMQGSGFSIRVSRSSCASWGLICQESRPA